MDRTRQQEDVGDLLAFIWHCGAADAMPSLAAPSAACGWPYWRGEVLWLVMGGKGNLSRLVVGARKVTSKCGWGRMADWREIGRR